MAVNDVMLRLALQNAVFHNGRADPRAVLGRALGSEPGLRSDPARARAEAEKAVKEVNRLSLEEQKARLLELDPGMLEKKAREKDEELPPLPGAVKGRVVTRFAPSPTGPLNIAQLLRAAMMSFLYARKYSGRFILRIEDTDPGRIEKRFYRDIKDDLRSAGIEWDRLVTESSHMSIFYRHARTLLLEGRAYMCTCPPERFRELKLRKQDCPCRDRSPAANLLEFRKVLKGVYGEGKIAMRLRTSMSDPNPALRDPPLMRVKKAAHPLLGRRFSFWPLYNYAAAVEDHLQGITHVFRGKEHEHNTETQRRLCQALGWDTPETVNFGMIYLPGEKLHTRDMKRMISEGKVSGWDDPRLHTVKALVRRGFVPEAFRRYAIQVGLTKSDIRMSWENLESFNRSAIDPGANRYMVVTEPARLRIRGGPASGKALADIHPEYPERGKRSMPYDSSELYVSRKDFRAFKGKTIRLKNLFNIRLGPRSASYEGDEVSQSMPKVQWVSRPNLKVRLVMPDRELICLGEVSLRSAAKGDIIQMERLGYGRIEGKGREIRIIWTHG